MLHVTTKRKHCLLEALACFITQRWQDCILFSYTPGSYSQNKAFQQKPLTSCFFQHSENKPFSCSKFIGFEASCCLSVYFHQKTCGRLIFSISRTRAILDTCIIWQNYSYVGCCKMSADGWKRPVLWSVEEFGGWGQQVYNRFKAKWAICSLLAYCSHLVHITQATVHPAAGALYSSSIYLRVRTAAGGRNLHERLLLYDQNDCLCYL